MTASGKAATHLAKYSAGVSRRVGFCSFNNVIALAAMAAPANDTAG
ncbi:hypothetical protein AB8A05_15255 [Tardiphaga sp. 538_B7_N1_4]|jgi:acetoin utilization deacetylase AcuC-like enzyme